MLCDMQMGVGCRTCCDMEMEVGGLGESYLALRFVLCVECLELLAPAVAEALALVRAKQRPVRVRLDPGRTNTRSHTRQQPGIL